MSMHEDLWYPVNRCGPKKKNKKEKPTPTCAYLNKFGEKILNFSSEQVW